MSLTACKNLRISRQQRMSYHALSGQKSGLITCSKENGHSWGNCSSGKSVSAIAKSLASDQLSFNASCKRDFRPGFRLNNLAISGSVELNIRLTQVGLRNETQPTNNCASLLNYLNIYPYISSISAEKNVRLWIQGYDSMSLGLLYEVN